MYLSSDVEVIGTTVSSDQRAAVDSDSGRARIDHLPIHVRAFKTPTLRNVTLTAPYMHNGAFRTLDDVLRFYDRGGTRTGNQTLAADSLHLSTDERRQIITFLWSLVDTAGLAVKGAVHER
jgi:cytochrome c peroxidase